MTHKRIKSFSHTVDMNIHNYSYLGKRFLWSPYQVIRKEIEYDDGTEEIEETIHNKEIWEELK